MKKSLKKTIVILLCLSFIFTAVSISSAEKISNKEIDDSNDEVENNKVTRELTVYRHGPDGEITPQKLIIEVEEGQDLGEAIAKECGVLFDNDVEMQALLPGNNSTSYFLKRVTSRGRGIHLKFTPRIQIDKKIDFFPLIPPNDKTAIFIPIRYSRYMVDPGAYTRISALNNRKNITEEYYGPHQVLAVGFIGYRGAFFGHLSFLGFFIRTGFAGACIYVTASEF